MNEIVEALGKIWDYVQRAASLLGSIIAVIGVFVAAIKPLRKKLIDWVRKQAQTEDQEQEIISLREDIAELGKQMSDFQTEMREALREERDIQKAHNKSIDEKLTDLQQGNIYTLGDVIREVYHNNKGDKQVSEHEYDLCKKVWELYGLKWKQNGPVKAMWDEIQTWEKDFN